MSCMFDVICAFCWAELVAQWADALPCSFNGSFVCFSEQGFVLCEDLLDGIEIRAVWWQEEQLIAGS